jgi:DNA replication and repair protein RecF
VIEELRLRDFRCFERLDMGLSPGRTFIVGRNAQGKTSILEAACVLLRLQSPRTHSPAEMIRAGAGGFSVDGRVADTHLACRHAGGVRSISLDSKPQHRSDDYLATARVAWFANTDMELVKGGGSTRRRYLDFLGSQAVPGYRKAMRDYERTLRSRNALLKENRPRREVEAFDGPLVESGSLLLSARASLCSAITAPAVDSCASISDGSDRLGLVYRPGIQGDEFARSLAESRGEEARLRQTVRGPHRDDIGFELNGLDAAAFASEGQQRGIALSLKIAQARHLEQVHGVPPVLLLDDIFGELDTLRRNRLFAALPSRAQSIITTTFLDWAADEEHGSVLHLSDGNLAPQS